MVLGGTMKTCTNCIHASGIRADDSLPFSYFCGWLESVLPPPLADVVYSQLGTGGAPFIEAEDYEGNAELCRHYEAKN
jgi:hypothetical protein